MNIDGLIQFLGDQWPFGAGLLALTMVSLGLGRWAGAGLGWLPLLAIGRAVVQLSIIALLLRGILAVPWTVALFVLLMLSTASWTSAGRIKELYRGRRTAAIGVLCGALVTMGMIFALHLVDFQVRYIVSVGGIIIGNSMSAASLSGRNFLRASRVRAGEIEGWLALGATPSQANAEIGRESIRESLIPTLDQTKATGLVTLPGAFVGALFGGASPVVAAQFQLVVLAGITVTMMVTAIVVTRLAGLSPTLPVTVAPSD